MPETPRRRRRSGELWTDECNAELVELLRAGLPVEAIAEQAGRSVSALATQCRKMLPPDFDTRPTAVEALRGVLADPDYDWRSPLRELARRARTVYWDAGMVDRLRQGWERATPLDDLCEEFEASEIDVARQLLRLGAAESMFDVVERLGCDPHGTLAGRLRIAADRCAAAVWILIVDGALTGAKTQFGSAGPGLRHVSVHHDYDTADLRLAEVLLDHVVAGGRIQDVTTTIVERTIGDGAIGFNRFLTGSEALPTPAVAVVDLDDSTPTM
ncbi:hypothetical protein [Nocardia farcinica]|uniref:hypothetical protein n=1 Tax=Nocardia farcinica TaxID=37329 RepID=UPI000E000211|nr:hypothetical protein [Nocardia farcinica]SUH41066.1 Uncharacterised protein [Nocardia farcinica]